MFLPNNESEHSNSVLEQGWSFYPMTPNQDSFPYTNKKSHILNWSLLIFGSSFQQKCHENHAADTPTRRHWVSEQKSITSFGESANGNFIWSRFGVNHPGTRMCFLVIMHQNPIEKTRYGNIKLSTGQWEHLLQHQRSRQKIQQPFGRISINQWKKFGKDVCHSSFSILQLQWIFQCMNRVKWVRHNRLWNQSLCILNSTTKYWKLEEEAKIRTGACWYWPTIHDHLATINCP